MTPAPVFPEFIYAPARTIAALAGVQVTALERWIAAGQLVPVVTVEPNHPRKIIRLYRLSEVLSLKASGKE